MTKNKSIDGLKTKSEKTREESIPSLSEDFISDPDTSIWDSITFKDDKLSEESTNEPIKKPAKKPVQKSKPKAQKPTKVAKKPIPAQKPIPAKKPTKSIDGITKPKPVSKKQNLDFLKPIQAFDFDEDAGLTESDQTIDELKNSHDLPDFTDPNEDLNDELFTESNEKTTKKDKKSSENPKSSEKVKKVKQPKKPKKKPSKKRKIASIIALIIVLILIGGVIWAVLWGNDIIAKLTGGRGNILDLFSFTNETYDPLKTDENGRTNILAFGTSGYDMNGEEGGGVHDGAQLTDSIMLISFDQNTGDVAMLSLPRDLKGPSTCTATGKINEVYWCNNMDEDDEEAGATALMEAVGYILDVDIQYYAHLNWGSLASIVDILGGITITLDEDVYDYEYTGAVFEAGVPYTINGFDAVALARARHGTSAGDFSRGASQQKIIIGIKNKLFESHLSIPDLLGLVSTLGDNLRTNFSIQELKTLAHSTEILNFDVMRQISLYPDYMTTGNINGISYVLPIGGANNYYAIQKYVATQLSSDPRVYEEPTIAIYNATDTDGLAAEERTKLETAGFDITTIDNAPAGDYPVGTTIYALNEEKPGTKNLLEEHYGINATPGEDLPAVISPDYDFIIILNQSK